MAFYESKVIQVHPRDEARTISQMERFGWELKSTQDVVTKDSHSELIGDDVYSVTETERFIKLMFQRDTEGEHYSRFQKGESVYDEIIELQRKSNIYKFQFKLWPDIPKWLYIVIVVGCFIVGGCFLGANLNGDFAVITGTLIAMAVTAVVIIACRLGFVLPKERKLHDEYLLRAEEAKKLLTQKEAELKALGF